MTVYIVNASKDARRGAIVETRLREAISDLVKVDRIEDVVRRAAKEPGDRTYIVLVLPSQDRTYVSGFLDVVSQYSAQMFFIMVGDEISATEYKALLRSGRADWVSANAEAREVVDIIARSYVNFSGHEGSNRKAVVTSLVPSAGGVGNATLACEIGVSLSRSRQAQKRLCIVDLDFQGSHVCDYLDVEPRLQIQEISSNPERLDAHLFDIFISRHPSGLHVFAAPRSKFDMCELNVAALDRFFEMASARYDLMLIDLPPAWFAWTSQVVFASDGVIVTGLNTIPSLRQTVETLSAVRESGRPGLQIAVVVNRCERSLVRGIARRRHVETLLGNERVFYVGEEPMATHSINSGSPMAFTNSYRAIRKDIASLGAFCTELKSSEVSAG